MNILHFPLKLLAQKFLLNGLPDLTYMIYTRIHFIFIFFALILFC